MTGTEQRVTSAYHSQSNGCTTESISKTGLCALTNQKGVTLKKKYNVSLLKPFYSNKRTALELDKE